MVDVRELKIGNYVYLQNSKTPYKITEIGYSEIEYPRYEASGISSGAVFRTYVENLNPIPLTEGLLLKCGFTESHSDSKGYIYSINGVDFLRHFFDTPSFFIETKEEDLFNNPIDNLHQLQNLYFDLIGQELDVNL